MIICKTILDQMTYSEITSIMNEILTNISDINEALSYNEELNLYLMLRFKDHYINHYNEIIRKANLKRMNDAYFDHSTFRTYTEDEINFFKLTAERINKRGGVDEYYKSLTKPEKESEFNLY